jgi:anti-sigma-K factor RskA
MAVGTICARLSDNVVLWRRMTAVLATVSLALFVAAITSRDPPDFSTMPTVAFIRNIEQRPIWAIRLARTAHQIAADSLFAQPIPANRVYQLWLLAPEMAGPHPLGLLPRSGRKKIAVSPENARLLAGAGELLVTLEPPGGSQLAAPTGPTFFRGTLEGPS